MIAHRKSRKHKNSHATTKEQSRADVVVDLNTAGRTDATGTCLHVSDTYRVEIALKSLAAVCSLTTFACQSLGLSAHSLAS